MIATFTRDDIIRYVYLETSEEENFFIEQILRTKTDLQQFYEEMLEVKNDLDCFVVIPSDRTIQKILAYSQNFPSVQMTH